MKQLIGKSFLVLHEEGFNIYFHSSVNFKSFMLISLTGFGENNKLYTRGLFYGQGIEMKSDRGKGMK